MEDQKSVVSDEVAVEHATPQLTKKQKKSIAKQEQQMKGLYARIRVQQQKARRKLKVQVALIRSSLGAEDFKNLKDICTQNIPEQKGPDGSVIQKSRSVVNYRALVVEGKQAIVLNREARILAGQRKRSTGRASQRKAHVGSLNYINLRNATTLATETVK